LSKGLGLNRGDACLEGRTAVLPERCDGALVRVLASTAGAGDPLARALAAGDGRGPIDTARSQQLKAEACIAFGS
jgi:hypothetical protein